MGPGIGPHISREQQIQPPEPNHLASMSLHRKHRSGISLYTSDEHWHCSCVRMSWDFWGEDFRVPVAEHKDDEILQFVHEEIGVKVYFSECNSGDAGVFGE